MKAAWKYHDTAAQPHLITRFGFEQRIKKKKIFNSENDKWKQKQIIEIRGGSYLWREITFS